MQSVLVTGVTGMLGVQVYKLFAATHGSQYITSISRTAFPGSEKHFQLDLTDVEALGEFLNENHFDLVVHCAAFTDLNYCKANPEKTNILHVTVPGILSKKIPAVYYISTDSVFDGQAGGYKEEDKVNPLNLYAISKQLGEQAILETAADPYILRCNIFGFHQKPGNSLFEWAYKELSAGNHIKGFDNVYFNPLYVGTLAQMILDFSKAKNKTGIYNFASATGVSKFNFLQQIAGAFGFDEKLIEPVMLDPAFFTEMRPLNTTLNTAKLSNTGILIPTIETCIQQLVHDFKQYQHEQ